MIVNKCNILANLLQITTSEVTVVALSAGSVWMITCHDFIFENSKVQGYSKKSKFIGILLRTH